MSGTDDLKVKLFDSMLSAWNVSGETIKAWGEEVQLEKTIEECAELIVALQHSKTRTLDTRTVASEIADVMVMVICATRVIGPDLVVEEMNKKLVRLKGRLETLRPKVELEDKYKRAVELTAELENKYQKEVAQVDELRLQLKRLQNSRTDEYSDAKASKTRSSKNSGVKR